ncbi:unnamed protein product [Chondrus crispus]|uniref:Uncharacterized protein n=1 Tax=Chondrus crispus TaxID=2769 RepID=R7QIW8_CHOCR|nr:unnamed protein product [Chondrus crispus]CDF37370.1 unnamed protein product [Chondrus crispus]|eukprot:XP_005717189.1 unnamed protein product [Chondrus crispus]
MATSASVFGLKNRQRAVFESVMSTSNSDKKVREWKVLVCDAAAQDSLSCLFQPTQLRRHGVTLHTQIDNPRGPVPDVPALYVIAPTPENIAWLLKDLAPRNQLYNTATVCFTSFVTRPLLMALAAQMTIPAPVTLVKDLYADFVSYEQNLFSLNIPNSYLAMKSAKSESAVKSFVDVVVSRLLSVLLTLGAIPIIRAQRGGAAEAVASALDKKLRDNLKLFQRSSFASRALSFRRPLLLMLDRDFDFNSMLHHTWTYQALVHDCLGLKLNNVFVNVSDSKPRNTTKRKQYTMNKELDTFWAENAASPFPQVADAIEKALAKYREEVEEINRNAGGRNQSAKASVFETSGLAATIASLPELSRRKETIDVHTNIATALLENINQRSLDSFFELESQIMTNTHRPATALSAEDYKIPLDRLRLFLIYYSVFGRQLPEKTVAEFRGILHNAGVDSSIIEYVGRMKGYRHDLMTAPVPRRTGTINTAKLKGIMTSVVSRGYRSFANVAQNAKNLVVEEKKTFAVSRTLEIFMSEQARSRHGTSANDILEGYLLFDPKAMRLTSKQKMERMVFSDAIVFTVGGGNYVEYENCVEIVESRSSAVSPKNVLYGTTELLTSEEFLAQMASAENGSR